jgi:hypothetical protein
MSSLVVAQLWSSLGIARLWLPTMRFFTAKHTLPLLTFSSETALINRRLKTPNSFHQLLCSLGMDQVENIASSGSSIIACLFIA